MDESSITKEEYKFIDTWLGRLRYTLAVGYDSEIISWKSILVNGIDGKSQGNIIPLRWYNFLKRRAAIGAVLERENCPALVDERGRYRIYFED